MFKERVVEKCKYFFDAVTTSLPDTFNFIKEDCYIAGGSIVSTFQNEEANDIDIYFRNNESKDKFIELVKNSHLFDKTVNCYQIENSKLGKTVQFIVTFTDSPEKMIETFDFMHCKVAYDPITNSLVEGLSKAGMSVHKAIYNKKLSINPGCRYPIRAIERLAKFASRGYELENRFVLQFLPLLFSLNVLDEKVLEDQLNGLYGAKANSAKLLSQDLHSKNFNNKMDNLLKGDIK